MQQKYLQVLGVPLNVSEEELKKAFRQKAKLLHPDVNSSENAHEQFVLLTEAYEYMLHYIQNKHVRTHQKTATQWDEDRQRAAREKARQMAKMQYEEFINSDYYKTMVNVLKLGSLIFFGISFIIFSLLSLFLLSEEAYEPIIFTGMLSILSIVFFMLKLKEGDKMSLKDIYKSLIVIGLSTPFQAFFYLALNIFLFIKFSTKVIVSDSVLQILYLSSVLIGVLVFWVFKLIKTSKPHIMALGIMPLIVSGIFMINSLNVSNIKPETHYFRYIVDYYENSLISDKNDDDLIALENDAYKNYSFVRFFHSIDYEEVAGVRYYIGEGIFGIRVIKHYEFVGFDEYFRKRDR
ncbi:MAG: J domain-containing protein [Bacteroidales bacterium]|jgi:hypothetical protein|nr:DnaJ domain-containing protein [Bacteroidales bacterium]